MLAQTQTTLLIYAHVKALLNLSTAVEFFNLSAYVRRE